ncbi:MAG: hypothetical protein QOE58_926, partial [Actinomycetota bacterium]|nr:hypothetical protein [Actinomycetota bacterium]
FTSTVAEILKCYKALLSGGHPGREEPPRTLFRDHVAEERRALADPEAEAFFDRGLEGAEPVDFGGRSATRPSVAERRVVALPLETQRGLEGLADSLGVPCKDVLLAAHAAVVALWTGRTEVLTGLVVNGRPQTPDADQARGMYLNTLPVRLRLEGRTGKQLVEDCYAAESALLVHRTYPGAALERRSAHGTLVTCVFNYTRFHAMGSLDSDATRPAEPGSGVSLAGHWREIAPTNYPLYVSFDHGLDGQHSHLALLLAASPQHFADWEVDQLVRLFRDVLHWLASEPDSALMARHLVTSGLRRTIVQEWGRTGVADGPVTLLPDAIDAVCRRRGDDVAVSDRQGTHTYGDLANARDALAAALRSAGVHGGDLVAVCLPRGMTLLAAVLAVWDVGAGYVPLDGAQPAARTGGVLRVAEPAVVLVDEATAGLVPSGYATIRVDERCGPMVAAARPRRTAVHDLDTAYVMFTSGSTGIPKGVIVQHAALAGFAAAAQAACPGEDRVMAATTIGFDISFVELILPLARGAHVVMYDPPGAFDPDDLARALADSSIQMLQATPTVWAHLADTTADLEGLLGWCGGEALPLALAQRLLRRGVRVWNWYGPTETTIWSTCQFLEPDMLEDGVVPIGRPLAGESVYVLDAALDPVAPGLVGDLYIGGLGLALGYLGRAGETSGRFLPDPFVGGGARMYHTGDRARWRAGGILEFRGRNDSQVKVHGVRIELAEVENALLAYPGVRQAAVAQREDSLVAFVVAQQGGELDPQDVRQHAGTTLPAAVVPIVVVVDALPLNANGKVDRKALPLVVPPSATATRREDGAALDPLEGDLAQDWAEALGVPSVGGDDDFFALGGDSLRALRLVAKAQRRGLGVTPRD